MPDLELVRAPHWDWLAVGYFYLGGLAGGSYALAAIADLFGRGRFVAAVRWGYLVAFPAVVLGSILLVVDLTRPERFWHMLLQSERGLVPVFKWWSPISVGSWALFCFGGVALLSFLGTLACEGRLLGPRWRSLRRGSLGRVLAVVGGALGCFVAAYTGVLLSVTNRPLWAETTLWGLLFGLSAASTSAALLALLSRRAVAPDASVGWLTTLDARVLVLEALAIAAVIVSLGASAQVWLNHWGVLLGLGVVGLGIVLPLALHLRVARSAQHAATGLLLVLVGGFVLRAVIVLSVEGL